MRTRDYAAVIATAVFQITAASSMPAPARRLQVENLLSDELANFKREIRNERDGNRDDV